MKEREESTSSSSSMRKSEDECQVMATWTHLFRSGLRRFSWFVTGTIGQETPTCRLFSTFRPFGEIPGPRALPLIGTLYKYLPFIGEYDFKKMHKNGAIKFAKYGSLVREEIIVGEPIVWVFRPEDIAEVFKADIGHYPERRSHQALFKYRKDRSCLYNTGGLLPTNGLDWWRLRKEFQKTLSKPQSLIGYLPDTDDTITKFTKICEQNNVTDILPLLSRLFLELTCSVAFDLKINSFSEEEMQLNSMSSKLIDAAFVTNSAILRLDNGPRLWRFFETPLYRKLCKAQSYMEKIAIEMVSKKISSLKYSHTIDKQSLLETYLCNTDLDYKDVIGMTCDMLLAGIDTTTYSSAFALYYLAKHPESQMKIHAEAIRLLGKEDIVTDKILKQAVYTKAVIKETLRLNPISIGVGRILQVDVVLNGFHVRKGTNVVTQNQISCRLPEYFDEPNSFIPERWIREIEKNEKLPIHPYLVLPFGHGPRSCIARRLAEQNMQILLLRICQRLKFDWKGGELDVDSDLINKPNAPLNLKFHPYN